jgi:DNA replication protein DnaC
MRLKSCADNLPQILERAEKLNSSTLQAIEQLLDPEMEYRRQNRIYVKFKQSKLFEKPTIDQFDFHFHISRTKQKARILHLMDLTFIPQKKDMIFIGHIGTGKSFLAKCIAYAATQAGVGALFTTLFFQVISARHEKNPRSLQPTSRSPIGSINLLSFGRSEESIMRLENPSIADELLGSIQK